MRSSFFEFHVASTGLHVARAGLETTSNNVANASTKGYSRQYSKIQTNAPLSFQDGRGMIGTGASFTGVGQIRDGYIDQKYWSENSVFGNYSVKVTQLSLTEGIFNELSGSSLTNSFNTFFDNLQKLTTNAGDPTYKTNVAQLGDTLAKQVNAMASDLRKQQQDINTDVKTVVELINSSAKQITSLNKQIRAYEMDGSSANDLRDRRSLLVDELSRYVNVEVSEIDNSQERDGSDKRFVVSINGSSLVNHFDYNTLDVKERTTKLNSMDAEKLYDVGWSNGNTFNIYNPNLKGELKALIDMRDGNNGVTTVAAPPNTTTTYKGIPHYLNKLNTLVRTFAKAINHGVDQNGNVISNVTGHVNGFGNKGETDNLFFTYKDLTTGIEGESIDLTVADYDKLDCFNFVMSGKILNDPTLVASADTDTSLDESNNKVILSFLNIKTDPSLFKEGRLEDYIIGISAELGITKKQADKFASNYKEIMSTIENQRISVSGVDTNEEIVNMIRFNQLYQASAKLINIIDGIYDTCINKLGV